jgi:hypothetical protein
MKKLMLAFIALFFLLSACKNDCNIKYPKNIKPIDWENYNDVYTVYWNFCSLCDQRKEGDRGKEIKLCGWVFQGIDETQSPFQDGYLGFPIISNEDDIFWWNFSTRGVGLYVKFSNIKDSLQTKFDKTDITQKCFIKGILDYNHLLTECCRSIPTIIIASADDIYFEK